MMNRGSFKAGFLFLGLLGILTWCGWLLKGSAGLVGAFMMAFVFVLWVYYYSDQYILSLHRAQPLEKEEAPEIFELIRELSEKARIPFPKVCLLPSATANMLTVGRDPGHVTIAVSYGLIKRLNREELSGVFSHEICHIVDRDILCPSILAFIIGCLSVVSDRVYSLGEAGSAFSETGVKAHPVMMILGWILVPFLGGLVHLNGGYAREYCADRFGGLLCGNPLYLASALRKIDIMLQEIPLRDPRVATAHLFLVNPLPAGRWRSFFNTHPRVEERIRRLEILYGEEVRKG